MPEIVTARKYVCGCGEVELVEDFPERAWWACAARAHIKRSIDMVLAGGASA